MNSIFISLARRTRAGLARPVMTPVRRPAVRARVRPWPSWASKDFISRAVPSGWERRVTEPSVMVPSTSMMSTWIWAARFLREAEVFGRRAKQSSGTRKRITIVTEADCATDSAESECDLRWRVRRKVLGRDSGETSVLQTSGHGFGRGGGISDGVRGIDLDQFFEKLAGKFLRVIELRTKSCQAVRKKRKSAAARGSKICVSSI